MPKMQTTTTYTGTHLGGAPGKTCPACCTQLSLSSFHRKPYDLRDGTRTVYWSTLCKVCTAARKVGTLTWAPDSGFGPTSNHGPFPGSKRCERCHRHLSQDKFCERTRVLKDGTFKKYWYKSCTKCEKAITSGAIMDIPIKPNENDIEQWTIRQCTKCELKLALADFYRQTLYRKDGSYKYYWNLMCKKCHGLHYHATTKARWAYQSAKRKERLTSTNDVKASDYRARKLRTTRQSANILQAESKKTTEQDD